MNGDQFAESVHAQRGIPGRAIYQSRGGMAVKCPITESVFDCDLVDGHDGPHGHPLGHGIVLGPWMPHRASPRVGGGSERFRRWAHTRNPEDDPAFYEPPRREDDAETWGDLSFSVWGPKSVGGYGQSYFPRKFVIVEMKLNDWSGARKDDWCVDQRARVVGMTDSERAAATIAKGHASQTGKRVMVYSERGWGQNYGPRDGLIATVINWLAGLSK